VIDREYNQYVHLHFDMDVEQHMDYQVNHMFAHHYRQLDRKHPENKKLFFFYLRNFIQFTLLIR
jgi:hypothetical protein